MDTDSLSQDIRKELLRTAHTLREVALHSDHYAPATKALDAIITGLQRVRTHMEHAGSGHQADLSHSVIAKVQPTNGVGKRHIDGKTPGLRVAGLYRYLTAEICGQDESLDRVARAITRSELGMGEEEKPRASMIFLGPTGVGKTETALRLAEFLYGSRESLERYDMAEFSDEESLRKLLGKTSEEAGALGNGIDRLAAMRPESSETRRGGGILLFDEIEKASPAVTKLFLSILDAGRYTQNNGKIRKLKDFVLIFTSNLGGKEASRMRSVPYATLERTVRSAASRFFAPELFARFTEVCVYRPLTLDTQWSIAKISAQKELKILERSTGIKQERLNDEVLRYLVANGFDAELGARPMKNFVRQQIGDALANLVIATGDPERLERVHYELIGQKLVARAFNTHREDSEAPAGIRVA